MNPPEHYAGRAAESAARAKANRNRKLAHKLEIAHHTHTKGPWFVLPDPVWKGKHPLHDARFIATSSEVYMQRVDDETPGWRFENDTDVIICTMPDSINQKANAKLIASAPAMLACIADLQAVVNDFMPNIGQCALQDYGRLNRALLEATRLLNDNGPGAA
ncbi:MAG: hypothetical protein V4563_14900 [Pseudomonadota bacterium]